MENERYERGWLKLKEIDGEIGEEIIMPSIILGILWIEDKNSGFFIHKSFQNLKCQKMLN
ncbi:hypothetical protein [Methanosarcina horonobensis]|uniref:hypothetical protein n=1 Tax=Methanosarcina horonobensis TaxID=418008 RepID=UPI00064EEB2E|nr:hypothetical protein [Methanosarcina horonobensis]